MEYRPICIQRTYKTFAMTRQLLYSIAIIAIAMGCSGNPSAKAKRHSAATATALGYADCKQRLAKAKVRYRTAWPRLDKAAREKKFITAVVDTIIPHWIGTPWDFNGTTETPGQGSIACGYFVTTVLRDAGLPLQRIKLAQCASEQMITTLVQPAHVQRYSNMPFERFLKALLQQGRGLYIVGLDNHTGFLYHDGQELYFIHASYIGAKEVATEKAADALILRASRYRITGKLSADEAVLERWVNSE
jgi:hypothetical protein